MLVRSETEIAMPGKQGLFQKLHISPLQDKQNGCWLKMVNYPKRQIIKKNIYAIIAQNMQKYKQKYI